MEQAGRMTLVVVLAIIVVFSVGTSAAQQPQQAKPLQFVVAAIKPGNPRLGAYSKTSMDPSEFRMVNVPLQKWIEMGLSVKDYALKAPSWIDKARFDLDAKLPAGEPVNQRTIDQMMKALLIERFGLKWHEDLGNVAGYELVPGKNVRIKPSGLLERMKGRGWSWGPGLIQGTNVSMGGLATRLGKVLGRPVVDTTHLSGVFSFKLRWRPFSQAALAAEKQNGVDVDNLPLSVSSALRQQLGLRLQREKVPSKIIVVDHINRQPTGN